MKFEPVIGLEIHCELATQSKVFCPDNTTFGAPPNSQVCPVCLGLPGVLPVLNRRAVELALRLTLACHCEIPPVTWFDRKNYYYPDLPKNYQISQNYQPLGTNGWVEIFLPGETVKRIGIQNIHLEEDAGKLIHPEETGLRGTSLVDLNRAGMPLLEIVSGPDIRSIEEAEAYMQTMRSLLRYTEVSDCKMQEGSLRFEINISMRPAGQDGLPPYRVEVKNLGSIKVALKVIEYEMRRQAELLEDGERIAQETRLWDEVGNKTRAMRKKETAQDYRYFPEPDLPPITISTEWLETIRDGIPELQNQKRARFIEQYGLPDYDAGVLVVDKTIADYFEECVKIAVGSGTLTAPLPAEAGSMAKKASNWIMVEILRELRERDIEIDECPITPKHLAGMLSLIEKGTISGKIAKTVFAAMMETGQLPEVIVKEQGLVQVTDEAEIARAVDDAIEKNPKAVAEYREGKEKAKGFLVGHVMKLTRGKANPQLVNELIERKVRGG